MSSKLHPCSVSAVLTRTRHPVRVDALRFAMVRLTVGDLATEQLPDLAAEALVRGIDSPSLRLLAGTPRHDVREARDLFIKAMSELGVTLPPEAQGRRALVMFWAEEMVQGSLSPYDASRLIWWEGWEELGRPDDLTAFVGLASEWEDHPEYRAEYERTCWRRQGHLSTAHRCCYGGQPRSATG